VFIRAELSQIPSTDGRRAERRIVNLAAALREEGARTTQIVLHDISTGGFKAETDEPLEDGAEVWLKLTGLEAKRSRVIWSRGKEIGCEFEWPLHQRELEVMVTPKATRITRGVFGKGGR
jgi:hypothetical protein